MEYHKQMKIKNTEKLKQLIKELPCFCQEYFISIDNNTTILTRVGYAIDLKLFFYYLTTQNDKFKTKEITHLQIQDLKKIKAIDISKFICFLSSYQKESGNGQLIRYTNDEKSKARKLSSIRKLLSYFYKVEKIDANVGELISTPKIHDKNIIMLESNEIAILLDEVESGKKLTKRQQQYHVYTKLRDIAIISVLLGTGMRVSECVGIDIKHIDFSINGIKIIRKGGNESVLYFGKEVEVALKNYIEVRNNIIAKEEDENALFLSIQNKRICIRSVEKLVKKYASLVTTIKKISPHKLRSTYGTQLYRETGDIYLVADVLGHKDVNTTTKYYAKMSEEKRRMAASKVILRRED